MTMIDDSIHWWNDPKKFEGFRIEKNGKPDGYDVVGLLKGTNVWLRCGYLKLSGNDVGGFGRLFVSGFLVLLPFLLWSVWF